MNYKSILKNQDGWSAVFFYDLIAVFLISQMENRFSKLSANHITGAGLLLAVISLYLVLIDQFLAAAIALQIVVIIDCIDGKWARLRRQFSDFGKKFDAAVDFFSQSLLGGILSIKLASTQPLFAGFLLLMCLGSSYIHLRTIFLKEKKVKSDLVPLGNVKWSEFCKKNRLFARPIAELEVAFILPSMVLVVVALGWSSIVPIAFFGIYVGLRLISRPV